MMSQGTSVPNADSTIPTKESILNKVKQCIESAITLEILTVVSDTVFVDDGGCAKPQDKAGPQPAIWTRVNLIEGDIKTTVAEPFVTGAYKDLLPFHMDREKEAASIVKNNIAAMKALVVFVKELFDK